jgi:hypothetical protein
VVVLLLLRTVWSAQVIAQLGVVEVERVEEDTNVLRQPLVDRDVELGVRVV